MASKNIDEPEAPVAPSAGGRQNQLAEDFSSEALRELSRLRLSPEWLQVANETRWLNKMNRLEIETAELTKSYEREDGRVQREISRDELEYHRRGRQTRQLLEDYKTQLTSTTQPLGEVERVTQYKRLKELEQQVEANEQEFKNGQRGILEQRRQSWDEYHGVLRMSRELFLTELRRAVAERRQPRD